MKNLLAQRLLLVLFYISSLALGQDSLQSFDFEDGSQGFIDWSAKGVVQAQGFGLPAPNAAFDAQKELTACRAAQITAQARLLEIIEGVSIYGGTSISEAEGALVKDEIQTQLKGVLIGAVELPGSRKWDAEESVCELSMAAPLANIREAIPPLGISSEGKLVIVDGSAGPNLDAIKELQEQLKTLEEQIAEGQSKTDTPSLESSQENTLAASENINPEPMQPAPVIPVAMEDRFTMNQGETLEATVLANDQSLTASSQVSLIGNVAQGVLELRPDGSFSYQTTGSSASDIFKYQLTGDGGSTEAFVIISIIPAPTPEPSTIESNSVAMPSSPPSSTTNPSEPLLVAQNDQYNVVAGGTIQLDLFANDQSPSGRELILGPFGNTQNGSLSLQSNGKGSYTSYNNGASSDSFTYYVTDGQLNSNEATVTIGIIALEDNPPQTPMTTEPIPQAPQDTNSSQPNGQGGQAPEPVPEPPMPTPTRTSTPSSSGALPTGIIFDASGFSLTRSMKIKIESSSGITLYDNFKATYINNSIESAKTHEQAGSNVEILKVFTVDPKGINLILDQETTFRFLELLAQKDYGAENKIIIVRKDP